MRWAGELDAQGLPPRLNMFKEMAAVSLAASKPEPINQLMIGPNVSDRDFGYDWRSDGVLAALDRTQNPTTG